MSGRQRFTYIAVDPTDEGYAFARHSFDPVRFDSVQSADVRGQIADRAHSGKDAARNILGAFIEFMIADRRQRHAHVLQLFHSRLVFVDGRGEDRSPHHIAHTHDQGVRIVFLGLFHG